MLSVITPTHNRPAAMCLCERWMRAQTLPRSEWEWVIVTDGTPPILNAWSRDQARLIVRPPGNSGIARQLGNLLAGFESARGDAIAIIEEDDWYGPQWLELCVDRLSRHAMVAESRTPVYDLPSRTWQQHNNGESGSLFQTAFRTACVPLVREVIAALDHNFLDARLWRAVTKKHTRVSWELYPTSWQSIGIKGMPGTPNLGGRCAFANRDQDWAWLREKVGDVVADLYRTQMESP